ncbi:hypothetical protein [Maribacter sp. ACAM166]|uniref:hypothetical protein n=1 Tax=Maribacter sp. ACAM166 TaxID=2508996 RepID=UPI0014851B83|nr:hypothetical protein [Maribacter sp. ACAM166]
MKKPFWIFSSDEQAETLVAKGIVLFLRDVFPLYKRTKEIHKKVADKGRNRER